MIEELKTMVDEIEYVTDFVLYPNLSNQELKEHKKNLRKLKKKLEKGKTSECLKDINDDIE